MGSHCQQRFSRTEAATAWGRTSQVERVDRVLKGPCSILGAGEWRAGAAPSLLFPLPTHMLPRHPPPDWLPMPPPLPRKPLSFLPLINPPTVSPHHSPPPTCLTFAF